jgi:hypothetical protein
MSLRLSPTLTAIALALVVAACSKISEENFAKVQEGMTEQEVLAILGTPTESNGVSVLGVSGAAWRWVGRDAVIVVHFVNGKAALRSLERPAGS